MWTPFLKKSSRFGSFLVWGMKVCVIRMPRRKDINCDFWKAIVAVHHSGEGFKMKQFGAHRFTVREIIHIQDMEYIQDNLIFLVVDVPASLPQD